MTEGEQVPVWGEPSEPVLIELGRLTWAALNLEGVIESVAQRIHFRTQPKTGSDLIRQALRDLNALTPGPAVEATRKWLTDADLAMIERNKILHADVMRPFTQNGDGIEFGNDVLLDARSGTRTPVSVDALRSVRETIAAVHSRWTTVLVDLGQHLEVRHAGPGKA